jgi:hypothetical protein
VRAAKSKIFAPTQPKIRFLQRGRKMKNHADETRHIQRIEETDQEVVITFGKSEKTDVVADDTIDVAGKKDKDKYREQRPAQKLEIRDADDGSGDSSHNNSTSKNGSSR